MLNGRIMIDCVSDLIAYRPQRTTYAGLRVFSHLCEAVDPLRICA
jgi:hypothetical protein